MANASDVLIICRDLKSLRKLSSFKPESQNRYILSSDDPRVHEAAKRYPWIDTIDWIEQMESLYSVADDVIRLTETVNQWLKTLADDKHGFPEELLFFTRNVEGGMTTQRIQDLLLLIRSYYFLFDTYKVNNVILISQPGMGWEDAVLVETARRRDVDLQLIGRYSFGVLIQDAWSVLKVYARSAYYTVNVLRINLRSGSKSRNSQAVGREIVFQLCSSAYKHVENIVPLMKALKDNGYNPVALCWHSNERYTKNPGAAQIRQEGLQAEELEKWCSFFDLWKSICGMFWTWRKAKVKKDEFLLRQELNYWSVSLGTLLWPSVRFFIIAELAQSQRMRQALKKYFKDHIPLAIKLWGAAALREGSLAWKSLNPKRHPLIFFYALGVYIDWPYKERNSPIDLLFVAGENHKRMALNLNNISDAKIEICGQPRYEKIDNFKKEYNSKKSRTYLGIPDTFSMYILFDSNLILRGFVAQKEVTTILNSLLKYTSKYPSVALLVKPHPSHNADILNDMISSHEDLKNVFLIDNKMLPYHSLNTADILITKFSTLAIEAMLFDCPVICCVLDGEQRFNIYKDGADYIESIEKLQDLLGTLVTDTNFRQKWNKRHMQMRRDYLAKYFCEMDEPPAVFQAKVLDKYLKE